MSSATNYCLRGPDGQVVGFRLWADELGHRIYDILDWADEHFSSYFVEQTDDQVYVCSERVREIGEEEIRAEPLRGGDGRSGGEQSGNGPPSGGPSGGGGGGGPDARSPAGSSGGGAVAKPESP
jgi:hypothetical protein